MTLIKTKGVKTADTSVSAATALSKTVLNRLNAQTPDLSKFVVAFKDLSSDLPEDTGMNIGMIILDIKGSYYYIPVVSKSGNVQVIESIFDGTAKKFIPLTRKSVKWIIDKGHKLGKAERIPTTVARDPDLYDVIVPPRTGKYVYASEGRLGGFLSELPNHIKQATYNIVNNDFELQQALAPLMDIEAIKEFLTKEYPKYEAPEGDGLPQVITDGSDLTADQVQELMTKGYIVKNPPKSKRVAVEAPKGCDTLTRMSSMRPGTAMSAMRKNGAWTTVACLKMLPQKTDDSLNGPLDKRATNYKTPIVAVTEDGEYITDPNIIVTGGECNYSSVIERLSNVKATELRNGDRGVIFTGTEFIGPLTIRDVVYSNGWTNINSSCGNIMIHPNVRTLCEIKGKDIILSDSAVFYPLTNGEGSMETDLNTAEYKNNIEISKMLPIQSTLLHRNGVYAIDGKEIGSKPQIIEHLLREWMIDVPTVETFVKKAEDQHSVIIKLAAVRDGGRPTSNGRLADRQIYEQGDKPAPDTAMTGDARQRALGMSSSAKAVRDVADREVMEATIISEMLQNPDLEGSIREYLPDIKEAVDRLGRSLFLMRLNTSKLSDKIDAEALNNILTATRNAYRILGENCMMLENLSTNELD